MILLDTHAWIWALASPAELSERAMATIDAVTGASEILVSAISVWELFMLVKKKRLVLTDGPAAFVVTTERDSRFAITPVDSRVARVSVELPDIHADPADRIILATARELGCALVSRDSRFKEYGVASIVW